MSIQSNTKEQQDFFKDPKVWIALAALFVAAISLTWTIANQSKQNVRWERLNEANPYLKEVALTPYRELSIEEARKTKWGYPQQFYTKEGAIDIVVLRHYLICQDSSNQIIENMVPAFTLQEMKTELDRMNFKNKNITIHKKYRPYFVIENMGKIEAKRLSSNIEAKFPDSDWRSVFSDKTEIDLPVGQEYSLFFDYMIPINQKIPEKIYYRINLKYQDVNSKFNEKIIKLKWERKDTRWTIGSTFE